MIMGYVYQLILHVQLGMIKAIVLHATLGMNHQAKNVDKKKLYKLILIAIKSILIWIGTVLNFNQGNVYNVLINLYLINVEYANRLILIVLPGTIKQIVNLVMMDFN